MAFRFRRTVSIFPGVRINLGKRGVSVSAGVRGANVTLGRNGLYGNWMWIYRKLKISPPLSYVYTSEVLAFRSKSCLTRPPENSTWLTCMAWAFGCRPVSL